MLCDKEARIFQSKISIRNAFNAKSITIKTTTGRSRSSIESSRHCRGSLKFETQDKLDAVQKLAKMLGIYQEPALPPIGQSVTVNQVNLSGDNALEAGRRLAFALAKLSHRSSPGQLIEGDPAGPDRKSRPPESEAFEARISARC
jgi:hypothetical protein